MFFMGNFIVLGLRNVVENLIEVLGKGLLLEGREIMRVFGNFVV